MSSPVATIPEDKTVYDAASLMLEPVSYTHLTLPTKA